MSNFIFASHRSADAGRIFEALKSRGIFVRYWNKPRISNSLRITIGTDAEMEQLYAALTEILAKEGA
jgi:histidinol-phosphate aminotransferase